LGGDAPRNGGLGHRATGEGSEGGGTEVSTVSPEFRIVILVGGYAPHEQMPGAAYAMPAEAPSSTSANIGRNNDTPRPPR
jgi:hypothetical protein